MGCHQKNIVYGNYIYKKGALDSLYLFLNPGTYAMGRICSTDQSLYAKIFGTAQNYDELLNNNPNSVAQNIHRNLNKGFKKIVIDWKYPINPQFQKSRSWLNNFIDQLDKHNIQVYLKVPASYLCNIKQGFKYILDLEKPKKIIVQMYGQQPGFYTIYEQLFEKQSTRPFKNPQNYTHNNCPKYPSYPTLVKNFPDKQFFIQKTLQQQQAGYIGTAFVQYLKKAQKIYGKIAFLDSFVQQIIQL